ncbi:unnamed protein product [Sympodiomycopsis kandeliae]
MAFGKSKPKSTTRLPAALRDELGLPDQPKSRHASANGQRGGFRGRGGMRGVSSSNRGRSQNGFSHSNRTSASKFEDIKGKKRQQSDLQTRDRPLKKSRITTSEQDESSSSSSEAQQEVARPSSSSSNSRPKGKQSALQKLLDKSEAKSKSKSSSRPRPSSSSRNKMTQVEKDEEDEIAWLEAMLGGGKNRSSKGKERQEEDEGGVQDIDGYDELLDDLDRFYPGMYSDGEEGSDSEIDEEDSEDSEGDEEDNSDSSIDYSDEEEEKEEDFSGFSEDGDEDDDDASDNKEVSPPASSSTQAAETVIAASSSAAPPSAGRYIPPAARAAAAAAAASSSSSTKSNQDDTLEMQKLRRQLQGLLNRLGDSNLDSILKSLEEVYRNNRRAQVSSTLTSLILGTISMRSNLILTDTFVVVYASLVASLGRIVGMEFIAGLVSELVDDLIKYYDLAKQDEVEEIQHQKTNGQESSNSSGASKSLANLVVLLSHMYNLHVVACPLIYDLIKLFLGEAVQDRPKREMSELDVESLLKVVKTCGHQLRSDDASSLKQIVSIASTNASTTSVKSSSRTRFMLETLNNLNKSNSATAGDQTSASQMLVQMKKYLGGMEKKRSTRRWEPLRIGLKDLQDAQRRGKWWLVGGVWKDEEDHQPKKSSSSKAADTEESTKDDTMIALARQHGMNTPTRREIFITIMSSSDYMSAASDLLTLKLNTTQQREIIRVLLHCTGLESNYNPYYSLIGKQLCNTGGEMKKSFTITMQFCLWDYLRSLGEKSVGGKSVTTGDDEEEDPEQDEEQEGGETKLWNLSKCYAYWLSHAVVDLTILRPIPFISLQSRRSKKFLQLLFIHLLLFSQTTSPHLTASIGSSKRNGTALEKIFISATMNNVELLTGLHYFFAKEMNAKSVIKLVGKGKNGDGLSERVMWCCERVREILDIGLQSARKQWA